MWAYRLTALGLAAVFLAGPAEDLYFATLRPGWGRACGELVEASRVPVIVRIYGTRGAHPGSRLEQRWTATVAYRVDERLYHHRRENLFERPEASAGCVWVYYDPEDPGSATLDDPKPEASSRLRLALGLLLFLLAWVPRRWLKRSKRPK